MLKSQLSLDNASILVTGGTGSFGKAFIATLLEASSEYSSFDRLFS